MGTPLGLGTRHWSMVISAVSVTLPFQPGPNLTSTGSKADAMGPKELGRKKLIQSPGCPGPYSTLLTRIHFLELGRGRVVELKSLH